MIRNDTKRNSVERDKIEYQHAKSKLNDVHAIGNGNGSYERNSSKSND